MLPATWAISSTVIVLTLTLAPCSFCLSIGLLTRITVVLSRQFSNKLSNRLASPSLRLSKLCLASSLSAITSDCPFSPSLSHSVIARCNTCAKSSPVNFFKVYKRARDNNAWFNSKAGFSVVAPINIMVPSSICGKNASCCDLLKRCTSSTNSTVRRLLLPSPCARNFAFSMALRISFIPEVTADTRSISALAC